ncbi:HlyD family efflux transporter periplasmic adaptor subunit [Candidatus Nomurabacteria bacterium]|nr:HlyD family efflux transporter periplasmic adaptor subunit [Candidatus Nomurabacteria bacterium]
MNWKRKLQTLFAHGVYRLKRHEKRDIATLIVIGVLLAGGVVFAKGMFLSSRQVSSDVTTQYKRSYKTVQPKKLSDDKILLIGSVLSNESASIFPRRSGIVGDILVDIGDQVQKGQVLAYLLPEGVENQSNLEILTQKSASQKAFDDYQNTQMVEDANIAKMQQKLAEMKRSLQSLRDDNYRSGGGLRLENESLSLAYKQLAVAEKQLETALQTRQPRLTDGNNKISQARDSVQVALQHTYQTAIEVVTGGQGRFEEGGTRILYEADINSSLGVLDANIRNEVANQFNAVRSILYASKLSSDDDYYSAAQKAGDLLDALQRLVNASVVSTRLSSAQINDLSNKIHLSQDKLFTAHEKLQKAIDAYRVLVVEIDQNIAVLEEKVLGQKSNVELMESQWEKSGSEIASKIAVMNESVKQYEKEIEYAKAQAKRNVDAQKNQYAISNAQYLKTAAQKGHTAMISPFDGVISRRNIEVGQLTMMSDAAFELVDVQTTLSQKAKNEIQFGLPEELQSVLSVGDFVDFYLPGDETVWHTAEVTRMSPQVDPELHTFTVQAKLPDDLRLSNHSSVQVKVITGKQEAYEVDSSAIKKEDEKFYIWVLENPEAEKPVKVYVDVIEEDGEFAQITGSVEEGSLVILNYYGS